VLVLLERLNARGEWVGPRSYKATATPVLVVWLRMGINMALGRCVKCD
jgi:hypothetical protein